MPHQKFSSVESRLYCVDSRIGYLLLADARYLVYPVAVQKDEDEQSTNFETLKIN